MHSAIHWLKACGIIDKFVDDLMNADPLIPLPIENDNKPLVFTQLSMLWLIWVSGLIAGVLAFFGELVARIIAKKPMPKTGQSQRHHRTIQPMTEIETTMTNTRTHNEQDADKETHSIFKLE